MTPWDQLQRSGAHYNFFFFFVSSVCCSVSSPQTVDMSPTMYLCACMRKAKLSCTVISAAHLAWHIATKKIERKKKDKSRDGNGLFFYLPVCICHKPNSCQLLKLWFEIFSSLTHMQLPPCPPLPTLRRYSSVRSWSQIQPFFFFFYRPDSGEVYSPRLCVVWSDLLWCRAVQCVWPVVIVAVLPVRVGRRDPEEN